MTKNRLAVLAGMATMALSAVGDLAAVSEVGWFADHKRPSRPQPRHTSKSTHKQNARKAKKGQ